MKLLVPHFEDEYELQQQIKDSDDLIKQLLNVEEGVRVLALFSPNESYEEIAQENLIFLNLPYYLGLACQKKIDQRLYYIKKSKAYFIVYLNLLRHYCILS